MTGFIPLQNTSLYSLLRQFVVILLLSICSSLSFGSSLSLNAGLPAFPPFAYPSETASKRGVVVEIFKILEKELDITFNIQFYPYARMLESLKDGKTDLAILFKNESLAGYVNYVAQISRSKVLILSAANKKVRRYEDLYQFDAISVIRRASFGARFDRDTNLNKYTVENYAQAVKMLNLGRVDAVVGSQSGLQNALDMQGVNYSDWEQPFILSNKEWWVHFSNKSKHRNLIPVIQKEISKLYQQDLIYQLYKAQQKQR